MDAAERLIAACPTDHEPAVARVIAGLKRHFGLVEAPLRLGRYELVCVVGTGGCGTVWAARDRVLSREVAIKMLARAGLHPAVLMREARALACLSHPNVVECFDVGFADETVYLVMTLVRGHDLAAWLAAQPRSRAEILATFEAAAQGLAAAHRRGIVHRDFKPANLLVGEDGRVRVADFGLAAMLAGVATTHEDIVADSPISQRRVGGTLRYMAPEQHECRVGTAAVDVFAFCATLYEAFAGVPAFAGPTGAVLLERKLAGDLQRPLPGCRVPRDVLAAVRRGLAPDPERRPTDLVALVQALQAPPKRSHLALAGALALPVAIGAAVVSARDPCPIEPRPQAVASARIDPIAAYRDRLGAAEERACDAWKSGAISLLRRDAEMECIAGLAERADALADAMASSSITAADRRLAVLQLSTPESCAGNSEPAPAEVHEAGRDEAVRALARASADNALLRPIEAGAAARTALELATALGDRALEADALLELGRAQTETGAIDAAFESLQHAFWLATSLDRDRTAAAAATWLLLVTGQHRGDAAAAELWARHAESAIARDGEGSWVEAKLWTHRGILATLRGDARVALAAHERALAIWQALAGHDRVAMTQPLLAHASALRGAGQVRESLAAVRDVAAIAEQELGADDPVVHIAGAMAAAALFDLARFDEAEREIALAHEGLRRHFGPDDRRAVVTRTNLARMLVVRGEFAQAREHFVDLLAHRRRTLDARHPDLADSLADLGAVETRLGRWTDGEALLLESVAIFDADPKPDIRAVEPYAALATVAAKTGRKREAVQWLQRAVDLECELKGEDHPKAIEVSASLGRATAEAGDGEAGLALLERASRRLAALGRAADVASVDADRSVVLRKLGRLDEAIAIAERTLAFYAGDGPPHRKADAEVVLYKALEARGCDAARVRELVRSACAFYERVATEFPVQASECAARAS
jgi:tetratricopeptide (TPR) repeat protein